MPLVCAHGRQAGGLVVQAGKQRCDGQLCTTESMRIRMPQTVLHWCTQPQRSATTRHACSGLLLEWCLSDASVCDCIPYHAPCTMHASRAGGECGGGGGHPRVSAHLQACNLLIYYKDFLNCHPPHARMHACTHLNAGSASTTRLRGSAVKGGTPSISPQRGGGASARASTRHMHATEG